MIIACGRIGEPLLRRRGQVPRSGEGGCWVPPASGSQAAAAGRHGRGRTRPRHRAAPGHVDAAPVGTTAPDALPTVSSGFGAVWFPLRRRLDRKTCSATETGSETDAGSDPATQRSPSDSETDPPRSGTETRGAPSDSPSDLEKAQSPSDSETDRPSSGSETDSEKNRSPTRSETETETETERSPSGTGTETGRAPDLSRPTTQTLSAPHTGTRAGVGARARDAGAENAATTTPRARSR